MNNTDMENEMMNRPTDSENNAVDSALPEEPVETPVDETEPVNEAEVVKETEPVSETEATDEPEEMEAETTEEVETGKEESAKPEGDEGKKVGKGKESTSGKKGKLPFDLKLSKKAITIGSAVIAVVLIAVILTVSLVLTVGKKPNAKDRYTVTFETEGGSDIAPYVLHEGDTIARPADPTKALFHFVNWYKEAERMSVFDFDAKMPAHDITVYAGWASENSVLITFDANGGTFGNGIFLKDKVIDSGASLTAIDVEPTFTGYRFGGWSLTKGGQAYTFGQNLSENLTLYAIWNEDPAYAYVSYYANGELVLKSAVKKGESLKKAEYVADEGLVFGGWYVGAEKTEKYAFGAEINENLNLYGTFYTPDLIMNDGVVTGYYGISKNVVVPDEYNGKKITKIGDYAFGSASEYFAIKTVKLPSTVTEIGEGAFYNCNALENINLSKNVTKIGASAFSGCARMQTFGDVTSVTEIGERAFLGCENVFAVVLSDNLTSVGKMAFADCKNITEMVIPERVLNVPDMLFAGCSKLKKVDFQAEGMAQMTFGKEIFAGSGVETVIIRSKSRANFSAVQNGYLLSPFTGCENLTVFVDSATISAYRNYYGNLDNDNFGKTLAEIA